MGKLLQYSQKPQKFSPVNLSSLTVYLDTRLSMQIMKCTIKLLLPQGWYLACSANDIILLCKLFMINIAMSFPCE